MELRQAVDDRLRSAVRTVRPHVGGVANAREAVQRDERAAGQRQASQLAQARAEGPRSWQPLHRSPVPARRGAGHAVLFADSEADLVARLSSYVADGLAQGEVCVVIATAEHRAGLHQWLAGSGLEPHDQQMLVEHDADEVLDQLAPEGRLRPSGLHALIASLPEQPLRRGTLRAFGEVLNVLALHDELPLALELERLWDDAQRRLGFPLLCAQLDDGASEAAFVGPVCAVHTHLAGRVLPPPQRLP